ncbi:MULTISPECIES: hypothetical protein [Mycobacterium]|uniref:Uncharacterized protein n=1 Tax=Mycobacterium kiyosense TaxID=2871094 RepID=A0A9P3Q559_9MYCO|nr:MULTISPECIES: hypothetical protein [Mycobacterium]BDB44511.1 hypothetical protein IWGMT90018_49570 [Mycobacterium kiyosense]BDE16022.1 hypothetical protein MKCMC460_48820 [Mycobacterium sp. 20KCMC460]GLB81853.1 hypothetical protein SRL2020028_11090 [Mycobacterium kiyosense]GLB91299.1 hypothetical protein SRL2020130_41160 [Mycobacterium kiyosense]GLB97316.1 hypothetical protein SRL2020226_40920 [Mycobacterium kiyosense]
MRRIRTSMLLLAAGSIAFATGTGTAHAQPPSAGDSCTTLHATTKDADGQTMWCNPTMTGNHSLVWQYGGPG